MAHNRFAEIHINVNILLPDKHNLCMPDIFKMRVFLNKFDQVEVVEIEITCFRAFIAL